MKDSTTINLNKLLGKIYNYDGEIIRIESFKQISSGMIMISTNFKTLSFYESQIPNFIESLEENKALDFRDKALISKNTQALAGFTPSAENVEMKAVLMDMLAKVKISAEAIPQAKATCEIVNTLVNIQKTELEMIRMTNKSKSN